MNGLEIKRVPFMGTELMAARDSDGQIWAGVRWMCDGIGLSKGQMQRERLRIQEDGVLSKGERNLVLPTNGGMQAVLCLKLDYVPLWLAKISITPTMERETPELAETLEQYQLHAKDVLAAAFLPTIYGKEDKPAVQQRALTPDDYLRAASIVANCANGRLPYVLGFLEKGGFEIPKVEAVAQEKPELAQVIAQAIEDFGITITQIGQLLGVTRAQVYRYKNGSIPRGDRAESMIQAIRDVIDQTEN